MFNKNSCIYLDESATSRYKPYAVIRRVEKELKNSANAGRGGHKAALKALKTIEECRETVETVTFSDANVIMTKSCTEALNLALFGGKFGGEIVTTVYEHNAVLRPLEKIKRNGVKITYLSDRSGIISPDLLKKRLNKNVSLVVMSEMSNVTGTVQPIDDIGRMLYGEGIPFLVDGAQSLGRTNSDYEGVTMIAGAGHKGLHGPQGTGFLCYRKNFWLEPLIYGGTGTSSDSLVQPAEPPEGFEAGTLNTAGIGGLTEGIRFTVRHKDEIEKHISSLSERLIAGLKEISGVKLYTDNFNGVISFNVNAMPSGEVSDILDSRFDIATRAGIHCAPLIHRWLGTVVQGAVRASIGWKNTASDIDRLVYAVKEIASGNAIRNY